MASAELVLAHALAADPTLGPGRLICLDGPAASGKTTLAEQVQFLAPQAVVLHTDDMLEGWSGLPGLGVTLEALLRPVATGGIGGWRRWDWLADGWAEEHTLQRPGLVVLEGVGSGTPLIADLVTTLVWVDAPAQERRRRWAARERPEDVDRYADWAGAEAAVHTADRTHERADLNLG